MPDPAAGGGRSGERSGSADGGGSPTWALLVSYAQAHQWRAWLIGLAFVGTCQVLIGSWQVQFPSAGPGGVRTVSLNVALPVAVAALTAGSLHSHMAAFEAAAAGRWRRLEVVHLVSATLIGTAVVLGAGATSVSNAAVLARAMLIWTGMGVVSGRVLGRHLSWVVPVVSVFPEYYWGIDGLGRVRWWEWIQQPATSWPCWWLAAGSTVLGGLALWTTPWRWHRTRVVVSGMGRRSREWPPAAGRTERARRG